MEQRLNCSILYTYFLHITFFIQSYYFSVWRYFPTEFTIQQKLGFISFPLSFLSLALGTIAWHFHHREIVLNNLRFVQKVKVSPFFLFIILKKVWVLANLFNTLRLLNYHEFIILPFLLVILAQIVLHLYMGYSLKRTCLGSLANVITLWSPTHEETQMETTLIFYEYETILSSTIHLTLSVVTLLLEVCHLETISNGTWIGLKLVCLSLATSQLYARLFQATLFPPIERNDTDIKTTEAIPLAELIQSGEPFLPTDAMAKPACLQKSTNTVMTGQEKIKDLKWIIMLFLVSLLSFFSLMTMEVIKLDGENYL